MFAKHIKVINIDNSEIEFTDITQLYTIGNFLVIVYEDNQKLYKTDKFPILTLARMEVEF
jgi:hypothetical protein